MSSSRILSLLPLEQLSTASLAALFLVALPVLLVVGNVVRQKLLPKDPSLPPVVFHLIPWFGSAATYGMDPYKFLFDCREKYGDLFTFVLLGRKMTVALGPKGNNLILGGRLNQVSAEEAYTHLTTPVFGEGVVYDCPNDMLMQQKRMVKFGLSTENLRAYVGMITDETLGFMSKELKVNNQWQGFDALDAMSELTILTASRTLQGKEVRAGLDKTFAQRYEHLDGGFTPINFMFPKLPLPSYRRRDKAQKAMSEFYQGIIRKRREGTHDHEYDMISALQSSSYKDGTPLSDRDIAHMMIALLMAGQHTSSATSSWTLLHLAERPDVWNELYQEQKEKFGNPDGTFRDLTYEDLKELKVLDYVIRETLRLHAPIHSIMRKVISDIPVPNSLSSPKQSENSSYVIPKGHFVLASPGVAQMDPLIWQNAEEWNPHRWNDESGVAAMAAEQYTEGDKVDYGYGSVSKGTESPYQPFGAGRHRCIGESFAYVQLQTILATLCRNVELKLQGPFPSPNYQTMIVLPLKGQTKIMYKLRA
ncbi:hypothetical protein QFC22_006692 [Naganishia vaughanmartiniae]|uniref:Uncharacterized protein n=1 Tax=Naganishia vaughanmartiniae TaxID=1424756 RepID=A0ACC2WHS2_9TREE|nr:hypothetical protein QFC22_006692 [Naganishia vaughanmartiniae]